MLQSMGSRSQIRLTTEQQQLGQAYANGASGDPKYDGIVAGRGLLPGLETGLLSNTQK